MSENCAFISYRSESGHVYAELIHGYLERDNIPCFWDKANMRCFAGTFSKELKKQIENADDFILILSPQCLDCPKEKDTVFVREIRYARKKGKRIIPIFCGNFSFPDVFPDRLEWLPELSRIEWNTSVEKLYHDLLGKMTQSEPVLEAIDRNFVFSKLECRSVIEAAHPFAERISEDVTSVDICAICGEGILINNREYIYRLVERKGQLRFVMNHPTSAAAKDAEIYKLTPGPKIVREKAIPNAAEALKGWMEAYPEYIYGRTTDLFLPCAILIIHHSDERKNLVKVDFYSFDCGDIDRRSILIPFGDRENYAFYCKQFKWIWDHSNPIE